MCRDDELLRGLFATRHCLTLAVKKKITEVAPAAM